MTGYDIYKSAMLKLGYLSENGSIEKQEAYKTASKDYINDIGYDLCKMAPIKNLTDEVIIDTKYKSALCYGVAMLICVLTGDSEKSELMTQIYNSKRTIALSLKSEIKDNSPSISGV